MARVKRYYLDYATKGVSPSQLKRMGRKKQVAYMTSWFRHHYEDPSNETPRDEGEFIYVWGGPYDASDVIQGEFGQLLPFERMEEAIREVQSDGTLDWAPSRYHPGRAAADDAAMDERPEETAVEQALAEILRRLRRGEEIRYGTDEERRDRQAILDRLDGIGDRLAALQAQSPGIGHNGGPPVDDEGTETATSVRAAIAAVGEIRQELAKPEPGAEVVVVAASRLARFGKWMGERVKKAQERFVENGILAAVAWPTVEIYQKLEPNMTSIIAEVGAAVVRWAEAAMSFF